MKTLEYVTKPGDYGSVGVVGTNRNDQIGRVIVVPDGETITFDTLDVSNVFVPYIKKGRGHLHVRELIMQEYGGDGGNVLGSNVTVEKTYQRKNTPTRTYNMHEMLPGESVRDCLLRVGESVYDHRLLEPVMWRGRKVLPSYHVDALCQLYAVDGSGYKIDKKGVIENINMPWIESEVEGDKSQAIMGSEACGYKNVFIGLEQLHINMVDSFSPAMVFNTLENSMIGGADTKLRVCTCALKVRNVKGSTWDTGGITVEGIRGGLLQLPVGSYQMGHNHGHSGLTEEELRGVAELMAL